jgi:hypothetical protein
MRKFYTLLAPSRETRVLDIGGGVQTWTTESGEVNQFPVTLLNIRSVSILPERITAIEASATALPFADKSFDIAFSNSVIEHVGTWQDQQAFAIEARRVASKLWVQTPARSFPIEPHQFGLFVHFLPKRVQYKLARRFTIWGWLNKPTPAEVRELVDEVRLLTYREMKELFPDCHILKERCLLLTKSYIAVRHNVEK